VGISDHFFTDDSQEYESFIPSPSAADQQRAYNNLSACLVDLGNFNFQTDVRTDRIPKMA
jgi:hypothetical protein